MTSLVCDATENLGVKHLIEIKSSNNIQTGLLETKINHNCKNKIYSPDDCVLHVVHKKTYTIQTANALSRCQNKIQAQKSKATRFEFQHQHKIKSK